MRNPVVKFQVKLDTSGVACLCEAIEAVEELQDLASWRPEVERALDWLHQATDKLQIVEEK